MRIHAYLLLVAIGFMIIPIDAQESELPPACPDCAGNGKELARETTRNEIPITLETDSSKYTHGSIITLTGKVAHVQADTEITLQVRDPQYNGVVTIAQIKDIDEDGNFSHEFNTAGAKWKYNGLYKIKAQYGESVDGYLTVELTEGVDTEPSQNTCNEAQFSVGDYCMKFSITGGTVIDADLNLDASAVIINIEATEDGTITLNSLNVDGEYIFENVTSVTVDYQLWDDYVVDGDVMTINFPAGAMSIIIVAEKIIPEFGTIALLILAVSIISIIAVTRSRLSIMPRF